VTNPISDEEDEKKPLKKAKADPEDTKVKTETDQFDDMVTMIKSRREEQQKFDAEKLKLEQRADARAVAQEARAVAQEKREEAKMRCEDFEAKLSRIIKLLEHPIEKLWKDGERLYDELQLTAEWKEFMG
jgi:hypothetical protein